MTVNGIWEWASQVATPVPPEALRGKTLSIDGHIWLYESLKGCETHHQTSPNSYLITFFTRIQRLRELKITPIVVFDNIHARNEETSDDVISRKRCNNFGSLELTKFADKVFKLNILLTHMGVRSIISAGDGEAQCARLELAELTAGCISTDFDYFLFGGRNLYRVDFSSSSTHGWTHLSLGKMKNDKKIARPHLIASAILLGCDYYRHGVQGCGISTVFDVLAEFGDNGHDELEPCVILDRFASYSRGEIPARSEDSQRKLKLRRKNFNFNEGFPNCDGVQNAIKKYREPTVTVPNFQSHVELPTNFKKVEEILMKECQWSPQRMQKEVTTSRKRARNLTDFVTQTRIPEFFSTTKKANYEQIVKPCASLDEYVAANSQWMKRKKVEKSTKLMEVLTPKMEYEERRKRMERMRAASEDEDTDGVIVLDD